MPMSVSSAVTTVALSQTGAFDPSELCPTADWRDLSDGGYSEVYKAKLLGATVAVKAATSRKKTSGESLMREIRYLRLAGAHPNIIQPYGAFLEGGRVHLVLEFARYCLRSDRVARTCDPVIVMAGIARALVRIHSLGIVHRDIKARNVLVATENRALLIDFGLACDVEHDSDQWLSRTVGTKKYRPPEMRDGRLAHPSMDVYCYGLMVEKVVRQRRDRLSASDDAGGYSDAGRHERCDCRLLSDIAQQCTSRDPSERPSAWSLMLRLQRHAGDGISRCDSARERISLHLDGRLAASLVASGCGINSVGSSSSHCIDHRVCSAQGAADSAADCISSSVAEGAAGGIRCIGIVERIGNGSLVSCEGSGEATRKRRRGDGVTETEASREPSHRADWPETAGMGHTSRVLSPRSVSCD